MIKHETETLQRAAALLAQSEFLVHYEGLAPTNTHGRYKFVLSVEASEEILEDWVKRYTRQNTLVEPRRYDQMLGMLRDDSKREKRQAR